LATRNELEMVADFDSDDEGVFVNDPVLPEEKMVSLLYQII